MNYKKLKGKSLNCSFFGVFVKKALNPRSNVIPLSYDCGFLSRLAVDVTLLSALAKEVLPLSICPKTPNFIILYFFK